MIRLRTILSTGASLVGSASITCGAVLVAAWLGFVVAGVLLIAVDVAMSRSHQ